MVFSRFYTGNTIRTQIHPWETSTYKPINNTNPLLPKGFRGFDILAVRFLKVLYLVTTKKIIKNKLYFLMVFISFLYLYRNYYYFYLDFYLPIKKIS